MFAALKLVQSLRDQGYAVERDVLNRKIKQQFKSAEEFGAKVIITLGNQKLRPARSSLKIMRHVQKSRRPCLKFKASLTPSLLKWRLTHDR